MTNISELISDVAEYYASTLTVPGATATIEPDATWSVVLTGSAPHNLTATDLSSAQDEVDSWLLSNGHKRVSVWHGNGPAGSSGDDTQCVVAL